MTIYKLQWKYRSERNWRTLAIDQGTVGVDRLRAQAEVNNECHPGLYEYQIVGGIRR